MINDEVQYPVTDGFISPSKNHHPRIRTESELIVLQKQLLQNYVKMLDDPALDWGASGSRTKNQKMFREIRRITIWLRERDSLL